MIERPRRKLVAGAGIEPAYKRLMRPLPFHLATPQLDESGTASRCCPERARFWRPGCASWRPPCVDGRWCGQPELHRRLLNGVQGSCCWTMAAKRIGEIGPVDRLGRMSGAGITYGHPRRIYDKKNKHRCLHSTQSRRTHPQDSFHGGSFGVSGTPPVRNQGC